MRLRIPFLPKFISFMKRGWKRWLRSCCHWRSCHRRRSSWARHIPRMRIGSRHARHNAIIFFWVNWSRIISIRPAHYGWLRRCRTRFHLSSLIWSFLRKSSSSSWIQRIIRHHSIFRARIILMSSSSERKNALSSNQSCFISPILLLRFSKLLRKHFRRNRS